MAKELQLPDEFATPEELAMWEYELVPGVNVPRKSNRFHLSPGTAACLQKTTADRASTSLDTPTEESEWPTLPR